MTPVVLTCLAFLLALGLYLAALVARQGRSFSDGGASLPGWAAFMALGGVMLAGSDLPTQLALIGAYGLQASHLSLGLVLAALALVMVQKRLWLAARIAGVGSPGEALATYYGSVTLRLVMLTLGVLFALPYAAHLLSQTGAHLAQVTEGAVSRGVAVWGLGFALFLPAVIGGWRATLLIVAVEALLLAVLVTAAAGFAEAVLPGPGFLTAGLPVPEGVLADHIPGIVQVSAGIGKETAQGGIFTTLALLSGALALIGLALSPGVVWLGMTARAGRSLGFGAVWVVAGIVTGIGLLALPILVARMPDGAAALALQLAGVEVLAGAGVALVVLVAGLLAVAFFVVSGTLLAVREVVLPLVLPGLDAAQARLTARIALAVAFFLVATLATFSPLAAAVFGSLALPLSAQMFPALLGLAFVRWISRSGVIAGLIFGTLAVFFTEPPGLILFEGLFLDLPWGRWPLTIHSAGWGLALNVAAVLLVSIFTRAGAERALRDRLHDAFAAQDRTDFGGGTARGAKWSLVLIWAFLAIGPGAILGNTFFSQPIFTAGEAALGVPSLWVWQLLFWLVGVMLVWWLAYRTGLGLTDDQGIRPITLGTPDAPRRAPDWIAAGLARVNLARVKGR